jgi:hypothetical protein
LVLPVHDVNPTRRTPWVTRLLIRLNIGAFLLSRWRSPAARGRQAAWRVGAQIACFDEYAAKPRRWCGNDAVDEGATGAVGRDEAGRVGCRDRVTAARPTSSRRGRSDGDVPARRLAAPGSGNLLFLFVCGINVEDRLGRRRYLAF